MLRLLEHVEDLGCQDVAPEHRQVGRRVRRRRLLDEVRHEAERNRAREIHVETQNVNHPGIQAYLRLGFRLTGIDPDRFAEEKRVEKILVCTPDKDMAQLVRDDRVVLWDRRRGIVYDDAGVRAKWGVPPTSIPDWLGLVGDSSDGFPGLPGWGAKSAAAVLTRYGHYEEIPPKASAWEVPGIGGSRAMALAATLRDHQDEALLYRDLARLRTADDGVQIRQHDPDELRWDGAPRAAWEGFCEEWGLERLARRPHRWLEDG